MGVPVELFEEFEILRKIKKLFKGARFVVRKNHLALSVEDRFDIIVSPAN